MFWISSFIFCIVFNFDPCASIVSDVNTGIYIRDFRSVLKDGNFTVECNTTLGPIQGEIAEVNNVSAEVYNSVPYAQPPVGDLRFEFPQRMDSWNGTINTTTIIECAQFEDKTVETLPVSEDCLFYKIVIPLDSNGQRYKEKLPAVFWIHGGSYNTGSKEYYTLENIVRHFSSKKAIFIAPNYRLAIFGFLTALHPDFPGNYGLEDILMALKMVREDADNFGIDLNRIALAGESTGAAAASILAASPRTDGLISALVLVSGSSQADWAVRSTASNISSRGFIDKCNCNRSTILETKNCMKKMASNDCITERFNETVKTFLASWYESYKMGETVVAPVLDDYRLNDSIIPDKIEKLVKQRAKVPLFISGVLHEKYGIFEALISYFRFESPDEIDKCINSLISYNRKSRKYVIQALRQTYSLDSAIRASNLARRVCKALTDENNAAHYKEALLYAERGHAVYLIENNLLPTDLTVHGLDLALVFDNKRLTGITGKLESAKKISQKWLTTYTEVLTEFISTGQVTRCALRKKKIQSFSPFSPNRRSAYEISPNGTTLIDYHSKEYFYWSQTIPTIESLNLDGNVTSKA